MVNLRILGIALDAESSTLRLLLHPERTEKILSLGIDPLDAFGIVSVVQFSDVLVSEINERMHLSHEGADSNFLKEFGAADVKAPANNMPKIPMIHDLLLESLRMLGGKVSSLHILAVENDRYTSELILMKGPQQMRLGCRLADGVALALRCGAQIMAADEVVEHALHLEEVIDSLPEQMKTVVHASIMEQEGIAGKVKPAVGKPIVSGFDTASSGGITTDVILSDATGRPQKLVIHLTPVNQKIEATLVIEKDSGTKAGKPEITPMTPEEERWAALLAELNPETKEPM